MSLPRSLWPLCVSSVCYTNVINLASLNPVHLHLSSLQGRFIFSLTANHCCFFRKLTLHTALNQTSLFTVLLKLCENVKTLIQILMSSAVIRGMCDALVWRICSILIIFLLIVIALHFNIAPTPGLLDWGGRTFVTSFKPLGTRCVERSISILVLIHVQMLLGVNKLHFLDLNRLQVLDCRFPCSYISLYQSTCLL